MQSSRARVLPRVGIYGLLFLAAAVIWGFVVGYAVVSWLTAPMRSVASESIAISYDGEVAITGNTRWPLWQPLRPHTLSGELLPQDEPFVSGQALFAESPRRLFWDGPRPWDRDRLLTIENGSWNSNSLAASSTTAWFLVRDASDAGHAFFMGYDRGSKQCIGYIGRRGWTDREPTLEEQFVVGAFLNRVVDMTNLRADQPLEEPFECFFDEDRLVEVNLRTKAVRTITTLEGAKTIQPVAIVDPERAKKVIAARTKGQADVRELANDEHVAKRRLAVWRGDSLAIVDMETGASVEFDLPQDAPVQRWIQYYVVSENQLVVSYPAEQGNSYKFKLSWLAPRGTGDGAPTRVQEVQLAGTVSNTFSREATMISAVVPIPALMAVFELVLGPLGAMANGHSANYLDGLKFTLSMFWAGTLILLVICGIAAWHVYRRERGQCSRYAGWIAAAVFAFGLPGLAAYLIERRRAPLGKCAACGADAPLDQPRCVACNAERPRPRVMGTEVFA